MADKDIQLRLSLDNKKLASDLAKTQNQLKRFTKNAEKDAASMGAAFTKGFAALAAGAAVGAGIRGIVSGIQSAVSAADEMGKMAQKIAVPVETLSALSFAAEQAGVDLGQLQKALAKVAVGVSDGSFSKLGITATTVEGAFKQLAEHVQATEDPLKKTALAAKVFGERIGPDLIPLLNSGEEGISRLMERAKELGIVIDDDMAKASEAFNDTMNEVKRAIDGAYLSIAKQLLPEMKGMADYMASSDAQKGLADIADLVVNLGKAAFATAGFLAGMYRQAKEGLQAATGGGMDAYSLATINEKIAQNKKLIALQERQARFGDPLALKKLRADTAELQAQKQKLLAASLVWNNPPPPPPAQIFLPEPTALDKQAKKSGAAAAKAFKAGVDEAARAEADRVNAFSKLLDLSAEGDAVQEALRDYSAAVIDLVDTAKAAMLSMDDPLVVGVLDKLKAKLAEVTDFTPQDVQFKLDIDQVNADAEESIKLLERIHEEAQALALTIGDAVGGAFAAVITGSQTAEEALKGLVEQLLVAIAKAAILQAFGLGSGSFGSTLGGVLTGSLGRSSGSNVRIVNMTSGGVQTRTAPSGDVEVIIGAVTKAISRGGNPLSLQLERTYGIGRRG